jgi:hypothetical protein
LRALLRTKAAEKRINDLLLAAGSYSIQTETKTTGGIEYFSLN